MNAFTATFLAAMAISVALGAWLGARQVAHLGAHRDDVAPSLRSAISRDLHGKATNFAIAKTRLEIAVLCIEALLLLVLTLGGGLDLLDRTWHSLAPPAPGAGAAVVVSCLLLVEGVRLPLAAYRRFVVEQRLGLNRATPALFLADTARKAGLLIALSVPLAAAALWLMGAAGPYRWLALWVLWTAFRLARGWGYPGLVAPLFNRVASLPEGDLRARLAALMRRCGFALDDVMVMDGSRRSRHANAHVTGIAGAKRVVLLDTLVEALEPVEIEAVTAHEIGHLAQHHMEKYQVAEALVSLAWVLAFGWLAERQGFLSGLGLGTPSAATALALLLASAPVFGLWSRPVLSFLARRFEAQADAYAARHCDPGNLCRALLRLTRRNASPLSAHPLYAAFHHAHPALPARIEALMSMAEQAAAPDARPQRS